MWSNFDKLQNVSAAGENSDKISGFLHMHPVDMSGWSNREISFRDKVEQELSFKAHGGIVVMVCQEVWLFILFARFYTDCCCR